MFSQGLFVMLATVAVMGWAIGLTKKKGAHTKVLKNGDKMLKNHLIFAILGYSMGIVIFFFIGVGFYFGWEMKEDETASSYIFPVIVFLALLYGFIYFTFYYYNHRVIYSSEYITAYNAWGKAKSMRWEDLTYAEFNKMMQQIRLYSKNGDRIEISSFAYGLADFETEFASHHPYMVQRILDRPLY